jgi:hypothetical protein
VDSAGADAVRRARRRSAGWWRGASACPGWTRADTVAHLVGEVATYGQRLEGVDHGRPARPVRDDVLADQLAVVTYDLLAALRDAGPGAEPVAATALAEYVVHAHDVDPRRIDEEAAGAVLAWLHPRRARELGPGVGTLGELLLAVERGPGEWHRDLSGG